MRKQGVLEYEKFSDFLDWEVVKNTRIKHGEKKDLAEFINIHPTTLSQVLNGSRSFSDEQAYMLSKFLNLSEIESEYVLLLHQIENSQNKIFKESLIKKKNKIKKRSLNLAERVEKDREISDTDKSIFYSSWHYSCIWVYLSLEGGKSRDEIHQRTGIDKRQINKVLDFLREINLCSEENGKYFQKLGRMHLDKNSPHLKQHHINWRIKSIQKLDHPDEQDLNFTAPLTLSKKDFEKMREALVQFIQNLSSTVEKTDPEEIYLVNLDFIKV